ncbi:hypothetical protein RN22_08110 [Grimontia sp. AD028]|uniref:hypothetical protein n=1 Tax=Grimontia sp. AD028 TaxID=1581149 RepID=UPI00061B0728|nr:hypothetical protein [Grimontia sp. AD028]KKD60997.1 hypothetical protein RN22_08110 [Grimontia sp. AD028]
MAKTYDYSFLWRARHLILIFVAGAVPLTLVTIKQGISPILEDPLVILAIWALLSIGAVVRIIKERSLTKSISISGKEVVHIRTDGAVKEFTIDKISNIKILDVSQSLNGYKEKEMILEFKQDDEKLIVPVNIRQFDELYSILANELSGNQTSI